MHNYSINKKHRLTVVIVLIIVSFTLNSVLYELVEKGLEYIKNNSININNFISYLEGIGISVNQFTVIGIFGFLYWVFTKHLWKTKIIKTIHKVPDLSGNWVGTLVSSCLDEDGKNIELIIEAKIIQEWDKISIKCNFPNSTSFSTFASIALDTKEGTILTYTYVNNSNKPEWDNRYHEGCNFFVISNNKMCGRYYTNRNAGTHGNIILNKCI